MTDIDRPVHILLASDRSEHQDAAARIAAQGGRFVDDPEEAGNGLLIVFRAEGVTYRAGGDSGRGPRLVEFDVMLRDVVRRKLLSKKQPFVRALGPDVATAVDATAGLGRDAVHLACLGLRVHALERSPVLHALLEDALRRGADAPCGSGTLGEHLTVELDDARERLSLIDWPAILGADAPDVVFIDPMFPPKRKKSALAKGEIRAVRAFVGPDDDASELLVAARGVARRRVIVKRPRWADPLADDAVGEHGGKLVRYDVFRP